MEFQSPYICVVLEKTLIPLGSRLQKKVVLPEVLEDYPQEEELN